MAAAHIGQGSAEEKISQPDKSAIQRLINILIGYIFQRCSKKYFSGKKNHKTPFQAFIPNFIPDFFILNKRPLFLQWPFLVLGAI